MMARTQITLEPEIHRRARQRASELGISLAEYFRQLVRKDLGNSPRPKSDVSRIFNLGSGGPSNIATQKDKMIAEAIEADFERGRRRR